MWIVVAAAAGAVGSAYIASEAAEDSSNAMQKSADQSAAVQREMYYQTREDQMPWLKKGWWALDELQKLIKAGPGEFRKSPGYDFRLKEGTNALMANASATGGLRSGAAQKSLVRYGQDYASNEFDKFYDRWLKSLTPYQSMSNLGQTTAGSLGTQGQNYANAINKNLLYSGEARASGYMNQGNIWANALNQTTNALSSSLSFNNNQEDELDYWEDMYN